MGTVFVYLSYKSTLSGDQNVCYCRLYAKDLIDKDPGIKWIEFLPDPAIKSVS